MGVVADENKLRPVESFRDVAGLLTVPRRRRRPERGDVVAKATQEGVVHGFQLRWHDEIPWNRQGVAVHQLGHCGVEVLFRRRPEAQQDPRELIGPTGPRKTRLQSSLHGAMESFH